MNLRPNYISPIAFVLCLVTVSLCAPNAWARGRGERGQMFKELNLTAEQKEKLKEIHQSGRDDMRELSQPVRKAREELESALRGNASTGELKKKFAALQKLRTEFEEERFEKVLKIRETLTPEQRAKFKGMRKGRMRGARGHRGEG